jgi:hypothetical protein
MTGILPGWTTCMSACGRLAKTLGFTENPEVGAPPSGALLDGDAVATHRERDSSDTPALDENQRSGLAAPSAGSGSPG